MGAAGRRDFGLFLAFVIGWLLPILYSGLTHRPLPGLPALISDPQQIACLFISRATQWNVYWVQVQVGESKVWTTIEDQEYSPMVLFGHRHRIEWLLENSLVNRATGDRQRKQLAEWIYRQYPHVEPNEHTPSGIRFLHGLVSVEPGVVPTGKWTKPAPEDLPATKVFEIGTYLKTGSEERR